MYVGKKGEMMDTGIYEAYADPIKPKELDSRVKSRAFERRTLNGKYGPVELPAEGYI